MLPLFRPDARLSNILISDKQLAPEEKGYFKDAVMMVENEDLQKQLLEAMKNREILEMGDLTDDREFAGHFFFFLGILIAADGKIKNSEVKMLSKIFSGNLDRTFTRSEYSLYLKKTKRKKQRGGHFRSFKNGAFKKTTRKKTTRKPLCASAC